MHTQFVNTEYYAPDAPKFDANQLLDEYLKVQGHADMGLEAETLVSEAMGLDTEFYH